MCEREREISKTLESVSEYVDVCVWGGRENGLIMNVKEGP